jgi:peptidyl-dipeptidase Dcp
VTCAVIAPCRVPSAIVNPLLTPSPLPYQLPPFGDITVAHYREALDAGMAEQRAEIDAIAADRAEPDFANTIEALERSGQTLHRATLLFAAIASTCSTPEIQAIEAEFAPKLAAHVDAIRLDPALFARVDAVHAGRHDADLDAEQVRLVERQHLDFVLAGAGLDEPARAELADLNQQISVESTRFQQNLLAATEESALHATDVADLAGASPDAIDAAAQAARTRGLDGYLVTLVSPTSQPLLAALTNRSTRERLHAASIGRAATGDHANGPIAARIAQLRARRAALLGFPTHAAAMLADRAAGSTEAVDALLDRLIQPALANARAEADLLAEFAARDGVTALAPWDWAYYSDRVRAERYRVDTAALRPYFELETVLRDGVFYAANLVYGITFRRREDLAGYHPDVRVWEVVDASGEALGLYLGDYFARKGKRGGAWMSNLVDQSFLLGTAPVVYNSLNIPQPAPGEPALLTFDEVGTLFHEFGHALHGLFSRVTYPRLSGTAVPRDVVEFPSQVNEMWMLRPEILDHYARHVTTGEALDPAVAQAIRDAAQWGEGFRTVEYLAATLLDQAWHRLAPGGTVDDPSAFEDEALRAAGVAMDLVPPRYRTGYFQHIFASGYSAGYYSYIWAEVLDADTVEWFEAHPGTVREAGDEFRRTVLARGNAVDFTDACRALLGREPDVAPLLRRRGLDRG